MCGKKLETVNSYVYLGFLFNTTLSLNQSATHLARKGRMACCDVIRAYGLLDPMTKDTLLKICDKQVQPILLYVVDVWGRLSNRKSTYLRVSKILGISEQIRNSMAY